MSEASPLVLYPVRRCCAVSCFASLVCLYVYELTCCWPWERKEWTRVYVCVFFFLLLLLHIASKRGKVFVLITDFTFQLNWYTGGCTLGGLV